jgi:hypothetical protein
MLSSRDLLGAVAAAGRRERRYIVPIGISAPANNNAAGATSIDVPWPTDAGSVGANVLTFMSVALKPGAANLGSVATPAGWTLVGSHIGGGYGGTLAAGTGNVRVYLFVKQDNTTAGNVTVSLTPDGANGVAAAAMNRIEKLTGAWQPVLLATAEATVDTRVGQFVPSALDIQRGDCLIYAFGLGQDVSASSLSAGVGFDAWSPPLANRGTSSNGFHVSAVATGRRAQRGLELPTQVVSVQVGGICRGPMIVARYRVR